MAPVGRPVSSGKNPFSKEEECSQIIPQDEIKQEPPDDESYHRGFMEVVRVKVEHEEDFPSYAAMNDEEGVVLKQEDGSEDEEEKLDVDILDDTSTRLERGDDVEKVNNSNFKDNTEDSSNSLLCKVCGKQFFRVFYFNLHMKTHKSPTVKQQSTEKPHKCHECGKSFAFLQHLTGHSRIHIAGGYYECPVCRRKFMELSNLSMHLLKTHPDEKPYKCLECDKQFTQSSALKKHIRSHSSNISQEDLDRIDMMFFVNDGNRRDAEEPLKKKIKLEVEEETTHPIKEKSPLKEEVLPKTKSPPSKEKIVRSPEKYKLNHSTKSRGAAVDSLKNDEPEVELLPSGTETFHTVSLSPMKVKVPPPSENVSSEDPTGPKESSFSMMNLPTMTESSSEDISVPSEDSSLHSPVKQSSLKELSRFNSGKEFLPLRNGVPLEHVKSPQIKVVKFAKAPPESEPLSVNGQNLNSPLKSLTGSKQSHLESFELMEETENSNQSFLCNGDKMPIKGRPATVLSLSRSKSDLFVGWEKSNSNNREALPSLEKPDGDYEIKFKCHRCEIFLDSEEKLHDHLMDHTGVKLCECRFCGKDFSTMTSLKRHLYYHVVGLIPQDCTRCGKTFSSFLDLKEHCMGKKCDASNSARYKCFRCTKQTSSLKKLKVHLLSQCNDEPTKYYFPKKGDGKNLDDDNKSSNKDASDQNAPTDEKSDSTRPTCQNDWITQKFEKLDSYQTDLKDLNCEPKDAEALMMLSELESEKGKECWHLKCCTCNHKFENSAKAKVHAEIGCGTESASAETKMGSEGEAVKIKVVMEEDDNLQCFLNCAECDKKVLGVEKMLLHIQEHIYEQNNLTCPVLKCGKLFKDPKEFKLHLKAHTGHKPFKCSDCGKRFFLRENYENHAQRHGILKHWSSFSTIFGEKAGKKSTSARSPITIESSIINLEVSEADVERRAKSTQQQPTKCLERIKEEEIWRPRKKVKPTAGRPSPLSRPSQPFHRPLPLATKPLIIGKKSSVSRPPPPPVNRPSPPINRPLPQVSKPSPPIIRPSSPVSGPSPPAGGLSPPISRPSPPAAKPSVNRPPTPVNWFSSTPPVNRSPPLNQSSPYVHRLPQIVKSSPAVHRQLIPVIRAAAPLDIPTTIVARLPQSIGPPIVNRIIPGHPPGGSLSVTPQGIFTVTSPRTYLSPATSSSIKSNFLVPTSRPSLLPKDPNNPRVHSTSSYYDITENSRASIQASNLELRKYPRSGRCEICKKICSRLDKHMMVHLNQKPHLCPVCPQAFRQSEHLRRHIRARHEGNHRQFECPQCEKRLTRKDKLKEHMKNCNRMSVNTPVVSLSVPRYLGNSLFDLIPGPARLSQPPLQGHTTA